MECQLRDECKNLLTKLKASQKCMKEKLKSSRLSDSHFIDSDGKHVSNSSSKIGKDTLSSVNISRDADTNLKPTYARNKLLTLCKPSTREEDTIFDMTTVELKDKESRHLLVSTGFKEGQQQQDLNNCDSKHSSLHKLRTDLPLSDYYADNYSSVIMYATAASPSRIRKRQLIDKHTSVETKLNPMELKELDDERLLNFNYSHINVDKNYDIKSVAIQNNNNKETVLKGENGQPSHSSPTSDTESSDDFHKQLQDQGNDRRYNNFLRDATIKPKSLLNSTSYYSLSNKGSNSRVRFNPSSNDDTPMVDQRLLGYDWIAALLDNEQNVINQSESFFHDICDFRKAYKEECNNKFYMESPYTLVDKEPEPVVEALTEHKVRPFVVNERLFTEPLNSDLLEDYYGKNDRQSASKEPTKENPRFVRVSIPRSTLQTPYRVKPHRRGSFDGSDSCSLNDHCLLGWENIVPNMMPPAKSLSLADDAGTQINSQTTTLADAERLATVHNQVQWHLSKPSAQTQILPRWKKHYMDLTLNLTLPSNAQSGSVNNASCLNHSNIGGQDNFKRKTDRILQSTYSTMYEMERLKQQRELERDNYCV